MMTKTTKIMAKVMMMMMMIMNSDNENMKNGQNGDSMRNNDGRKNIRAYHSLKTLQQQKKKKYIGLLLFKGTATRKEKKNQGM